MFIPRKVKIYPLSREEKKEVYKFVEESSLQIVLVFFVRKKYMKKRMVQDYHYLNSWTVKNNYTLLII